MDHSLAFQGLNQKSLLQRYTQKLKPEHHGTEVPPHTHCEPWPAMTAPQPICHWKARKKLNNVGDMEAKRAYSFGKARE